MRYTIQNLIKSFVCILLLLSFSAAKAQVSLIQNAIDKLDSYKNFSYRSVEKLKDFKIDTVLRRNNDFFIKAPDDKTFGYLFSLENDWKDENSAQTFLYDGQKLITVHPTDSTYSSGKMQPSILMSTLPGNLKSIKRSVEKNPSKLFKAADTLINGHINTHLIIKLIDTIIDKEHYRTSKGLYIDQQSGIPSLIIVESRYKDFGGINTYYDKITYQDYKFDQDNVTAASLSIPVWAHPPKPKTVLPPGLLATGQLAPNWTLERTDGKSTSLSQLKGKVVLLDFYFIGCAGCMASLQPLNNIYKKYLNKNLIMASLTERDSKKAAAAFDKQYHIKYSSYINAADVVKAYRVTGFPTFYFIDKDGKIAEAFDGYGDDFETKVTSILDKLLK